MTCVPTTRPRSQGIREFFGYRSGYPVEELFSTRIFGTTTFPRISVKTVAATLSLTTSVILPELEAVCGRGKMESVRGAPLSNRSVVRSMAFSGTLLVMCGKDTHWAALFVWWPRCVVSEMNLPINNTFHLSTQKLSLPHRVDLSRELRAIPQ